MTHVREKISILLKMISLLLFNIQGQKRINLTKTIYINFRALKFKEAIHFPIYVRGKCTIVNLKRNSINLDIIKPGIINIGYNEGFSNEKGGCRFRFNNSGSIHFKGSAMICTDATLESYGRMVIGNNVFIGNSVKIFCHNKITIQNNASITLECQVFDTNFHYVRDVHTGFVRRRWEVINIGQNVWIGNRTTVMMGARIPAYSIVASNSLVNKNLENYGECSIFVGCPAKCVGSGTTRIYDIFIEREIDSYFRSHSDILSYDSDLKGINTNEICWYTKKI